VKGGGEYADKARQDGDGREKRREDDITTKSPAGDFRSQQCLGGAALNF
jgi:hypothetical protein